MVRTAYPGLQQRYAGQGVQFIGIALENEKPVIEYVAENPINYPILLGGDNGIAFARQLGNRVDAALYTVSLIKKAKLSTGIRANSPKNSSRHDCAIAKLILDFHTGLISN